MTITVILKDGTTEVFPHETRPGGSYANSIRYEGGFAIVTNVWGKQTAFPVTDIAKITTEPRHGW